jgi:hypothetical protein
MADNDVEMILQEMEAENVLNGRKSPSGTA